MRNWLLVIGSLLLVHGCTCSKSTISADGGCNEKDLKFIQKSNFGENLSDCTKTHFFGMVNGVKHCLNEHYHGFSDSCGECYGEMSDCAKDHCLGTCMKDPTGDACRCCVQSKCMTKGSKSFMKCSGLPKSDLNMLSDATCKAHS